MRVLSASSHINIPSFLLFIGSMFASRIVRLYSSHLTVTSLAATRTAVASSSSLGDVVRKIARSFTSSSASMVGTIRDVSVTNFAEEVESAPKDSFLVLDVREPRELDLARLRTIPHINVPMSKLGNAAAVLEPIDPSKAVYVICHHGVRSRMAAEYLYSTGRFNEVVNVAGGIAAYAAEVDPRTGHY